MWVPLQISVRIVSPQEIILFKKNAENALEHVSTTIGDVKTLTDLVLEVVKQNKDLITLNTETQKQNQEHKKSLFLLLSLYRPKKPR